MALEKTQLFALIGKIGINAAEQRVMIHDALVSIAVYAQRDNNMDPCIRLMAAIGTGVYRAGISKWLSLNAPIHFVNGEPKLSKARKNAKEAEVGFTIAQYEADLHDMPKWHEIDEGNNKAPNVWDSASFTAKVDEYLLAAIKKAAKHDQALVEALDQAHNAFRSRLGQMIKVVEK